MGPCCGQSGKIPEATPPPRAGLRAGMGWLRAPLEELGAQPREIPKGREFMTCCGTTEMPSSGGRVPQLDHSHAGRVPAAMMTPNPRGSMWSDHRHQTLSGESSLPNGM